MAVAPKLDEDWDLATSQAKAADAVVAKVVVKVAEQDAIQDVVMAADAK